MSIGRERHRVTLMRTTTSQSPDSGEEIGQDRILGRPWAEMRPLDGTEAAQRDLRIDRHPTRFLFRWSAKWNDLNAKDWIALPDGRHYDLASVFRFENWRDRIEAIGVIRR